ncbi:MAG TPA: DUF3179 domain-containing protein [Candidatus Acidoferrales bacterium]|nr:DUF3179 domain-containing protein [Candidatus Acidoferrales bacterium]
MAFSRREFLTLLGSAAVVASSLWQTKAVAARAWSLEDFSRSVQAGGPPKDGIPPIDKPKYLAATEAEKFLKPKDIVFGLDYYGVIKAYPQKILVWHEIVNDEMRGERISVTYCPLTGSAVAFRGRSRDGTTLTFGTSGKLVNSNLLMYDRQTDSQWPQILGVAIDGKSKGVVLDEIPLAWTHWSRWRRRYPETLVLSSDTGYFRSYGRDPYGSYDEPGTYYDSGGPFFPVMAKDDRLAPKAVVVGVKANGQRLAIRKQALRERNVANISLAGLPLVAIYDPNLDIVRVFARVVAGSATNFVSEKGSILDELTGSQWTAEGRSIRGKAEGTQLKRHPSFDVMWFAWYAFFPQTQILS